MNTCCPANCHRHGSCEDDGTCSCSVWFTAKDCSLPNWVVIMSVTAVGVVAFTSFIVLRVRHYMKQRALRPRLNSATEHLLLNPTADQIGFTEAEASKLTKLRQDLLLRTVTIDYAEIKLRNEVGRGAFGVVHSAYYRGSKVAVKMVQSFASDQATAQEEQRAIRKEALLMTQLKHPNIVLTMGVTITAADPKSPHRLCIVTEFASHGSLFDLLHQKNIDLGLNRILGFAIDAATGMVFLHRHPPPILHHDLKSSNLLVDHHWTVKVCDFGNSRFCQVKSSPGSSTSSLREEDKFLTQVQHNVSNGLNASSNHLSQSDSSYNVPFRQRMSSKSCPVTSTNGHMRHAYKLSVGVVEGSRQISPDEGVETQGFQKRDGRREREAQCVRHAKSHSALDMGLLVSTRKGTTQWLAPELLQQERAHVEYASIQEMLSIDVYSFGIILWELATRCQPFAKYSRSKFAIEKAVRRGERPEDTDSKALFSTLHKNGEGPTSMQLENYSTLMRECWATNCTDRPTFGDVLRRLHQTRRGQRRSRGRSLENGLSFSVTSSTRVEIDSGFEHELPVQKLTNDDAANTKEEDHQTRNCE